MYFYTSSVRKKIDKKLCTVSGRRWSVARQHTFNRSCSTLCAIVISRWRGFRRFNAWLSTIHRRNSTLLLYAEKLDIIHNIDRTAKILIHNGAPLIQGIQRANREAKAGCTGCMLASSGEWSYSSWWNGKNCAKTGRLACGRQSTVARRQKHSRNWKRPNTRRLQQKEEQ